MPAQAGLDLWKQSSHISFFGAHWENLFLFLDRAWLWRAGRTGPELVLSFLSLWSWSYRCEPSYPALKRLQVGFTADLQRQCIVFRPSVSPVARTVGTRGTHRREVTQLMGTSLGGHCPLEASVCYGMRKLFSHRTGSRDVFLPSALGTYDPHKSRAWLRCDWVEPSCHTEDLNGPACLSPELNSCLASVHSVPRRDCP